LAATEKWLVNDDNEHDEVQHNSERAQNRIIIVFCCRCFRCCYLYYYHYYGDSIGNTIVENCLKSISASNALINISKTQ